MINFDEFKKLNPITSDYITSGEKTLSYFADFIVLSDFPAEKIYFCNTPAFLLLIMNEIPIERNAETLSKYNRKRIIIEKTEQSIRRFKGVPNKLSSHPFSTQIFKFRSKAELLNFFKKTKYCILYMHQDFFAQIENYTLRCNPIYYDDI